MKIQSKFIDYPLQFFRKERHICTDYLKGDIFLMQMPIPFCSVDLF